MVLHINRLHPGNRVIRNFPGYFSDNVQDFTFPIQKQKGKELKRLFSLVGFKTTVSHP
jgi:hypothetical protein